MNERQYGVYLETKTKFYRWGVATSITMKRYQPIGASENWLTLLLIGLVILLILYIGN
jgi:hypothetical protein